MPVHDVYFAAPLFSDQERQYNAHLAARLEGLGLRVFLPQRDGVEFAKVQPSNADQHVRRILDLDVARVEECPALVAVLDGAVPDEGVCVELGVCHEHRRARGSAKVILGLRSDVRSWQKGTALNPMILGLLDALFSNEDDLLAYVTANLTRMTAATGNDG